VTTTTTAPGRPALPRGRLAFVLLTGIVFWMVHLVGASVLVPAACEHGVSWAIDVLTVVTALLVAAGIPVAVGLRRRFAPHDDLLSQTVVFLAGISLLFEIINLGLILLEGMPNWFLDPCA
jgi:hypothetical protein